MTWRPWRHAMHDALYGPDGFYRRGERAGAHFRTSVHASALFAEAVCTLAVEVDEALGEPRPFDVVDVGAGGGELVEVIATTAPPRWRLHAVDVAGRTATSPERIHWYADVARLPSVTGLVVANEWLDNVPVDVVEDGRLVLVDEAGDERVGPPVTGPDQEWLATWWPGRGRAEIGRLRDEAWAAVVRRIDRGVAVAIDYAVVPQLHRAGTLTGYRNGREVAPVPDGSCDLTAHVLMEACAAAGVAAGATVTAIVDQRDALRPLGLEGRRPAAELAYADPRGYALALQRASEAAELTAADGLGSFRWLGQGVGVGLPTPFVAHARPGPALA